MRHLCLVMLLASALFAVLAGCDSPSSESSGGTSTTPPTGTALTVDTTVLAGATVGVAYSAAISASNGTAPFVWSVAGAVPNGLAVDVGSVTSATTLSGTPTLVGNFTFTVQIADGTASASRQFTMNVAAASGNPQTEQQLRQVIAQKNIVGLTAQQLPALNAQQVELGRLLFFDKILSGNQNVACSTCHHPTENMGDSLNLSVGVGGVGSQGEVGPGRTHPSGVFIPRNAQPVFATHLMPAMFWDKRIERPLPPPPPPGQPPPPPPNFVNTPEGQMQLAPDEAQALFPLVSLTEMRGTGHSLDGLSNSAYRLALLARLQGITEYVTRFNAAFPAGSPEVGATVNNMGRAMAQFERSQTFIDSPWDRYLRGDSGALTDAQKRGGILFFGRAACDACHNGPMLSNFTTHNIGVPQFGPGQGNGPSGREDFGFENVTGNPQNRYQFRVPPLRNVALTGPYMHNGAFTTLNEVVAHYKTKQASAQSYTGLNMLQAAALAPTLLPVQPILGNLSPLFLNVPGDLSNAEIADIVAFMEGLTDPAAQLRLQEIPATVPSGLTVDQN